MNRRTVTYETPLIPGDKIWVVFKHLMRVSEQRVSKIIITQNSIEVEIDGCFAAGEEVTYNLDLLGKEIFTSSQDAYKCLRQWKEQKQQN